MKNKKKHIFIPCGGAGCCHTKYCKRSFDVHKETPNKEQIKNLHEYCYFFIEYNLDTSAEHPEMDDDIVRYSSEKRRV